MKKMVISLAVILQCMPAFAASKKVMPATWLVSGIFCAGLSGILYGQVQQAQEDADYANHALMSSYEMMPSEELEGKQLHYLGELNKHKEHVGIFKGASYTMGAVSVALIVKGLYDYYHQDKENRHWTMGTTKNVEGLTLVRRF